MQKFMLSSKCIIIYIFIFLIAVEVAIRLSGLLDFPLYVIGKDVMYYPKPNQQGFWLHVNDWYFNDKSMPVEKNWDPQIRPNVFLIGNSVVMGGDRYPQQNKLQPLMQKILGDRFMIWPIAAREWSAVNEIEYLKIHPELIKNFDYFAWEYMAGGLSYATPWSDEYGKPTHRPIYATYYVVQRYLIPLILPFLKKEELPGAGPVNETYLNEFDKTLDMLKNITNKSSFGIIWLYPTKLELKEAREGKDWLPERKLIEALAAKYNLKMLDLATISEWTSSNYLADGVHPTSNGNKILASILDREILNQFRATEIFHTVQ